MREDSSMKNGLSVFLVVEDTSSLTLCRLEMIDLRDFIFADAHVIVAKTIFVLQFSIWIHDGVGDLDLFSILCLPVRLSLRPSTREKVFVKFVSVGPFPCSFPPVTPQVYEQE